MSFLPLLICVAITCYLSLYPWQFGAPPVDRNPLLSVFENWPALTRRIAVDIVTNVAFYVPFGLSCRWMLAGRLAAGRAVAATITLGAALSLAIEVLQAFVPSRVSTAADLLANTGGAALGALAYSILANRASAGGKLSLARGAAVPASLVCCWAVAQLYPLVPDLSGYRMARKLEQMRMGSWIDGMAVLADCATVVLLIWNVISAHRMLVAGLIMLSIPLRLLIPGRSFAWLELLAALTALAFAPLYTRVSRPHLWCAVLLMGAIVLRGLAPFDFVPTGSRFHWTPFVAAISGADTTAGIVLLKAFRYGALVWLLAEGTGMLALPGVLCVSLLASLEAAQMYFAGHVPESTDPLLAGILTAVMATAWRGHRRPGRLVPIPRHLI